MNRFTFSAALLTPIIFALVGCGVLIGERVASEGPQVGLTSGVWHSSEDFLVFLERPDSTRAKTVTVDRDEGIVTLEYTTTAGTTAIETWEIVETKWTTASQGPYFGD